MPTPKFSDEVSQGLSNALKDVRETFEEIAWGRQVTDGYESAKWPEAKEVEPAQTADLERDARDVDLDR